MGGGSAWSSRRFYFRCSLVKIHMGNIFFIVEEYDIASYADDNSRGETTENVQC